MTRTKTDISFKTFWDTYGYKRNRISAENVWKRMTDKDKRAAIAGIASYRQECRRTGVSLMHGKNYLLHRRWEDEICPQNDDKDPVSPSCDGGVKEMDIW